MLEVRHDGGDRNGRDGSEGYEKLMRTIFPCVLERPIRASEYWVTKEKDGGKLQGQGEELLDMRQK